MLGAHEVAKVKNKTTESAFKCDSHKVYLNDHNLVKTISYTSLVLSPRGRNRSLTKKTGWREPPWSPSQMKS